MKKWKKALTCGLLGVTAVCLSVFGFVLQPTKAVSATTTTVFSGNSAHWQEGTGFFHYADNNKTYVNNVPALSGVGGFKATAKSALLEGNSTINLSVEGFGITKGFDVNPSTGEKTETTYWGYNWIIFQDTTVDFVGSANATNDASSWRPFKTRDTDGDGVVDMPSDSAGNWLALVYGISESAVTLYECDGGKVTKEATIVRKSDGDYLAHNGATTDISISTVDTATGITVNITYTSNGNTYNYVHISENTSLWGEHTFTLGYWGNNTCETNSDGGYPYGTFIYNNISVTEAPSNNVYESYNNVEDETKWGVTNQLKTTAEGTISVQAPSRPTGATDIFDSYAQTTQVGGNSTIDLTMKGTIKKGTSAAWEQVGLWAYDWILFKNTNSNYGYNWHPSVYERGEYNTSTAENWLAFAFGASVGSVLYECNGGVITRRDIQNDDWKVTVSPDGKMSGYDTWYTYAQTTNIKITTKDTETGVFVKLTYYASDIDTTLGVTQTNHVYEYTYFSTNTNLWGDQSYVIGHYGNGEFNDVENYAYDIRIMDVKSTQTHNVAGDPYQWDLEESINAANVTFLGDDGMQFGLASAESSMLLKKNVKANSTLTYDIKGNQSSAGWGGYYIVFKDKSETLVPNAPMLAYDNSTKTWSGGSGTWLSIYVVGGRGMFFLECVDGVLKKAIDLTAWNDNWAEYISPGAIYGYDTWYPYAQRSNISITTLDLADSVKVVISYTASEFNKNGFPTSDANVGKTYTMTFYVDKAFRGDYGASFGIYQDVVGAAADTSITLSWMNVYEQDAELIAANSKSGMYVEDLRGTQLSMDGDIGTNLYLALAPCVWKDDEAQVEFFVNGVLYEYVSLNDRSKIDIVDINGTNCYKISCGLPAKDYQLDFRVLLVLRENVYVVYGDKEGEGAIIENYIESTKEFYAVDEITSNGLNIAFDTTNGENVGDYNYKVNEEGNVVVYKDGEAVDGLEISFVDGTLTYNGETMTKTSDEDTAELTGTWASASCEVTFAPTDAKIVYDTAVALEAYVKTAKEYFAYEEDASVDMTVNAIESQYMQEMVDKIKQGDYAMKYTVWNTNNYASLNYKNFDFENVTLLLKSETVFRLYIETNDISKWNVSVYKGDSIPTKDVLQNPTEGDNQATINAFWEKSGALVWTQMQPGSNYYYVDITGIVIADIDKEFAITVENTTDFSRITYTCSPYSYMRTVFNWEGTSNENSQLSTILRYMLAYQEKAKNYDDRFAS